MSDDSSSPYGTGDFSGGLTDNIYSNDPSQCAVNDNLFVDTNKKAVARYGSELYSLTASQLPSGASRVGRLFKFRDESYLFARNARNLYYHDQPTDAWMALTGPGGNQAYGAGTTDDSVSYSEWLGHIFSTDDAGGAPIKIYADSTSALQVRTAGMPAIPQNDNFVQATGLASLIALANDILDQLTQHLGNQIGPPYIAAPHATVDAIDLALLAPLATDLASLITLTNSMVLAYTGHLRDMALNGVYHLPLFVNPAIYPLPANVATLADMTLISTEVCTDIYGAALLLNDLRKCYNTHEGSNTPHKYNAGLAQVHSAFVYGVNKGPVANLSWDPYYSWYNRLRTVYNAHLGDGGGAVDAHSTGKDTLNTMAALSAQSPDGFAAGLHDVRLHYGLHEIDAQLAAGWAFHVALEATNHQLTPLPYTGLGSTAYTELLNGIQAGNFSAIITQIKDIATKFNSHSNDLTAHYTNDPVTNPPYRIVGSDWALAQYDYAMVYTYTYTVGSVTFKDVGPVYEFAADIQLTADNSPIQITGIPAITNDLSTNYDTANITVEIYRTTDAGNVFYFVGQVTNGTTTYSDSVSDAELITRAQLYTTDGSISNDPPPISKCIHIVNNIGYYGNITESGVSRPNRIRQSIPDDPDSCPGSFFDDIEDTVIGISSVRTVPVVFGSKSVYRLEGSFDSTGQGSIVHVAIHNPDSVGLLSENSLVKIENGIVFAGTDGFYFTDGYQLAKLSGEFNATYASLTFNHSGSKAKRIDGTYDKILKHVHWTTTRSTSSLDNDSIFTLNLRYGLDKPCFSTASNSTHFNPTAICMLSDNLMRGDSSGYLFTHTSDLTEDPYINTAIDPSLWGTKTIIIDLKSCAADFGAPAVRKWSSFMTAAFQNEGNLSLDLYSVNDSAARAIMGPITSRGSVLWGDPTIVWGQPDIMLYFQGTITAKRRFPAKKLRFTYKQVEFTNRYMLLVASSTNPGAATVDPAGPTFTLDNSAYVWPSNIEGQFILYAHDGYIFPYEVLQRVSDTVIQVIDTHGTLVAGSNAWQIWGYPKSERFHLNNYAVHAVPISTTQTPSRSSTIGVS